MTGTLDPRDPSSIISDLLRRVENLERQMGPSKSRRNFEIVFGEFVGTLSSGDESNRYPAGFDFSITGYRITADTAASTSSTVRILNNGSSQQSITLPASTQILTGRARVSVSAGDYLQVDVSSAGTGLADVLVVLECVR